MSRAEGLHISFELGRLLATPGALELLTRGTMRQLIGRHASGDWGDVDDEDKAANTEAVEEGSRIFSAYETAGGRVWIITEAVGPDGHRAATTVLSPDEY